MNKSKKIQTKKNNKAKVKATKGGCAMCMSGGCSCNTQNTQNGGFIGLTELSVPFTILLAKESLSKIFNTKTDKAKKITKK